jgi:NAD(P)-dependent dehydrogenase (short-subunit alcohol dehydrogenase family)
MPTFHEDALSGQHIVITGGVGALGVAIVKALADHGATVTVNDIVDEDQGLKRLSAGGVKLDAVQYVPADVTREDEVARLLAVAKAKFGVIHTALCHVGMVESMPITEVTADVWERTMNVNVKSAFLLGKLASLDMIANGIQGHLVFTVSWVADVPWPGIAPYIASKAAMKQLMRSFARELADQGIRANAMAPGIVGAGMAKKQWDTEPDYRARAQKAIPLGFMQPLESVANGFVFLCSDAAAYMTGSVLLMDGGCSLYPMD